MASPGLLYKRRTPALAAFIAWTVVLLGWVAVVLFCAWVVACVDRQADLADALFVGFCLACAGSLGLGEVRDARPRIVLVPFRR